MKNLPPAVQEDHRYLQFRIHSDKNFNMDEIVNSFWDAVLDFNGSKGVSKSDFWFIANRFSDGEQTGTVKVREEKSDDIRAALTLLENISGKKCFVEVYKESGTLKSIDE